MDLAPLAPRQDAAVLDDADRASLAAYVRAMTKAQRAMLKEHADGPQLIKAGMIEDRIRRQLAQRRLIRIDTHKTPRFTDPTPRGRKVIATILANEAEALIEAEAV